MRPIYFLCVTILILSSCRKDPVIPDIVDFNPIVSCPEPLDSTLSMLIVGDTNGMNIVQIDMAVEHADFLQNVTKNFSVWCTDTSDLLIKVIFFDGPGPSNFNRVYINSNTTLQFLQNEDGFITYVKNDTFYSDSNPTTMSIYTGYTCNPTTSNSVINSMEDQLIYLDSGDIFYESDYFNNEGKIIRGSWGYPPSNYAIENDTEKIVFEGFNSSCMDLPTITPKYIGFKMDVSGINKLGWVLVERISGSALFVHEIAVQR